ncbi:MAG: biotin transporter BioY [Oscillospiraceae bacterium]|jgi:biotin transport system substrate-specific component|nr:biotin transporter BioY [Oscillospiraceae bacterium]
MKINQMTKCALFTAIISVCAIISIPLPGGVPLSLATLAVYMCALILPPLSAGISAAVYVLLVAVGIPVTASGGAGLSYLVGPTGGYIIGYLFTAVLVSALVNGKLGRSRVKMVIALILGTLATYIPGTIWFCFVMKTTVAVALTKCVVPFLPGDAIKIVAAMELAKRLYQLFSRVKKSA